MALITTYGDGPGELGGHAQAADQQIRLEAELPNGRVLIGDVDTLTGHASGGDDDLVAFGFSSLVLGDARVITDHARGGDDEVWAGGLVGASAIGDALTLSGHAWGGNDSVTASAGFGATAGGFGDALTMGDHVHGGNDTLTGFTEHGETRLYGDAHTMVGFARGGDDVLGSTDSVDFLYGDADSMGDHARGGADTLIGQGTHAINHLYGDARVLQGYSIGGNDVLIAQGQVELSVSPALTWLYGDGEALLDRSQGGNDTLFSGANTAELMWGDAATVAPTATTGADLFVFAPQNGHDEIMDFQPGKDRIELNGLVSGGLEALATRFVATLDGVLISFDANDDILLRGITVAQFSPSDFIFG